MEKSVALFAEAKRVIPGGVNSPVRAFGAVGSEPLFIDRGRGAYIYDVDGHKYIDYVCSWGPLILGHAPEKLVASLKAVLEKGTSFGAPTALEVELAQLIVAAVASIEKVRLVNSGTEATMSAIRLARGFTKREKIIKFRGCYHGHVDSLLVEAGSGAATLGVPTSAGVPSAQVATTIVLPFNDAQAVKNTLEQQGKDIAAVILEPIAGNMGVIPPRDGFLAEVRELCSRYDILLIFDEVMTGFRVAYGGAQQLYSITPDLTCLGKIIGGGVPVAAYGGRAEIMDRIAPLGAVYQAGTLSGNPLAVTAGIETLKLLAQPGVYEELEQKAAKLAAGLADNAHRLGMPMVLNRVGSMMCAFFTPPAVTAVTNYAEAKTADTQKFARYFQRMLKEGIYLAPSQFEAMFLSLAHADEDLEKTITANYKALAAL